MADTHPPLILITNDDGVDSPGLAAAAAALDPLGDLLIVAPNEQKSGLGRAMPRDDNHDGRLFKATITHDSSTWMGYAVQASPAQAVQHALLELADRPPALAVSGINYGENVGVGITISGTVGAALEATAHHVPALAVSLEVGYDLHLTNEDVVDWSAAMHFTRLFARRWLRESSQPDVDMLNINLPASATPETPWRITRLERRQYYRPVPPERNALSDEGRISYEITNNPPTDGDTDVGAFKAGLVSVTPISLDMTSRVDTSAFHRLLEQEPED